MPFLGDKPSFGGPGTLNVGSRWQYNSPTRTPSGIILHTSEQSLDSTPSDDAESLCAFLATPGDRPNGSGGYYGSGYHAVTDSDTPGWWRTAPDQARTNSAPPLNGSHLHLCIPTAIYRKSSSGSTSLISRSTWLAEPLRTHIRVCADYIVSYSRLYSIPLVRCTQADLRLNKHGYADHLAVSLAFGQTDHQDVGTTFPWDVLASDILTLSPIPSPFPPDSNLEDDDMLPEIWHDKDFVHNVLYIGGGRGFKFASNEAFDACRHASPKFDEREVSTGTVTAVFITGTIS